MSNNQLVVKNISRKIKTNDFPRKKDRPSEFAEVMLYDKLYGRARREQKCLEGNKRNLKWYQESLAIAESKKETSPRDLIILKSVVAHFQYLVKNHEKVMKVRREKKKASR